MKVKNINETSDSICSCGSWIKHWKIFSNQNVPRYCPATGCLETKLVGALVQRTSDSTDNAWYIYPLCNDHIKHRGELEVSFIYKLVSANKKETCEK